ncbi:MAG TPA: polysaccharide biosynthesis/export family protein [Gemmataceae bacterium]|nr:polysaccharide biosynthesis/export family protein [Gemmataceae bacterium]
MRKQPCWMLGLSMILFSGMLLTVGCQSTASLPGSLKSDPVAKNAKAPITLVSGEDVIWKKSSAPSTAQPMQAWENPSRQDDSLRAIGFKAQQPLSVEPLPIPETIQKESPGAKPALVAQPVPMRQSSGSMVAAQPMSLRHGPKHGGGSMPLALPGAPTEGNPVPLEYRIRPPDVLLIDSLKGLVHAPVNGPYTVRPDGTVGIGIYGAAPVAGLTIEEARPVIARTIFSKMAQEPYPDRDEKGNIRKDKDGKPIMVTPPTFDDVLKDLNVNILAYNSSFYYVIVEAAGLGEQVYRFPVTGNETVLDGISLIGGLQLYSSPNRIWLARKNGGPNAPLHDSVYPVNWKAITRNGDMNTNWQVMPGDRIFVQADPMRKFSNNLAKFLEPAKEVLGITLLGSQTVNSLRSGSVSGGIPR